MKRMLRNVGIFIKADVIELKTANSSHNNERLMKKVSASIFATVLGELFSTAKLHCLIVRCERDELI